MRKLYKIMSVILSALILCAGISVFAAESCSVTAESPQGVFADIKKYYKAGDEFDLKVYVKADEPLLNGALYIRFDSNALFAEKLTAGGPLSASSPIIAGDDDAEYQEKNGYVSCTFSDTNSINYKTENILLTARFKLKSAVSEGQSIKVDFITLSGIADPQKPATMVKYIKSGAVVEAKKFSIRAELTGGSAKPETQAPTASAPATDAPVTQPATIAPDTQAPTASAYELGDVNRDGVLNIKDATLIQKYLVQLKTLDDEQKALADINGDNSISIKDATKIQHIIAKIV